MKSGSAIDKSVFNVFFKRKSSWGIQNWKGVSVCGHGLETDCCLIVCHCKYHDRALNFYLSL